MEQLLLLVRAPGGIDVDSCHDHFGKRNTATLSKISRFGARLDNYGLNAVDQVLQDGRAFVGTEWRFHRQIVVPSLSELFDLLGEFCYLFLQIRDIVTWNLCPR